MKAKYGPTPIPIPPVITDAKYIGRLSLAMRKSICALRDRSIITRGGGGGGSKPNPFDVSLIVGGTTEAPTYKVSVWDGWVNERIGGVYDPATNATAVHKPHNILWGSDAVSPAVATDRRTFDITVGQQVSVLVNVAAEGNIELPSGSTAAGPTEIAIEAEDEKSIHYVPPRPVDSDTGAAGVYHYKLAVLRAADATHSGPWLEYFLAGSHLDHFAELPILDNAGGAADNKGRVFKEYKKDANTYIFRVLDATAGELTIEESEDGVSIRGNENDHYTEWKEEGASEGDKLEFSDGLRATGEDQTVLLPKYVAGDGISIALVPGTTITYSVSKDPSDDFPGGGDLNLEIYQAEVIDSDGFYKIIDLNTTTPLETLYWRNGLYVGKTEPDDPVELTPDVSKVYHLLETA